jgi:anti-sigma regulatory factor (Ser/Thr protein kinase)
MNHEAWLAPAPESAQQARAIIRDVAAELRLDGPTTFDLMLATTEAFANAIEHGEPCDPRGIRLRVESRYGGLGVEVRDCGTRSDEEPRMRKLSGEGGRGMPIIAALMDDLQVSPAGDATRVSFGKQLAVAG